MELLVHVVLFVFFVCLFVCLFFFLGGGQGRVDAYINVNVMGCSLEIS